MKRYEKKFVNPLIIFITWFLVFIVICFIGIFDVFAATYGYTNYTAQLYDNYGPSLSAVTTNNTGSQWRGTIPQMVANSSGGAWGISSPIPLIANHTYSMTVRIDGSYGGNITLSTYNRIGVGTSLANAKSSYENNSNCTLNYSKSLSSLNSLQFAFTPKSNSSYIIFPFATTYSGNNQTFDLYEVTIDDLGSSGVSETTINNSLNNQTNSLNNSISKSENNIKNSIKTTEENIVNSNKETQNVIKDQFNTCRDSKNLLPYPYRDSAFGSKTSNGITFTDNGDGSITINGSNNGNGNSAFYLTSSQLNLSSGIYYVLNPENSSIIYVLYNNSSYLGFNQRNNFSLNFSDKQSVTLYIQIVKGDTTTFNNFKIYPILTKDQAPDKYEPYGVQICTNKLDEQNETSKGILGKIKDILSYINPFSENFFGKKLVELIINGLKALFVPDDFDFLNNFKSILENKLGFIASVPIQLLDYIISLKDKVFNPVTSITFPAISIFGFHFWNSTSIDVTQGIGWISAFKYLTDLGCVIIMVRTLRKWYVNFTGGDEK